MGIKYTNDMTAHTMGAFIVPMKVEGVWQWVVSEFTDDTFKDGDYIYTKEWAEEREGLIIGEEV